MEEERVASFIRSLVKPKNEFLEQLRKEALSSGVPIVRTETEALLSFFTTLISPKNVLEVGTAIGYSGISMLSESADFHLTTIENYEPRIAEAKKNFKAAGVESRVTFLTGDAGEILKTLDGPYEMIFMDAAKAQYITWLPDVLRLLAPGGVLISDNIFQDGQVMESRYNVRRRDRTIHKRMREYLRAITEDPTLRTSVIPLGDGVTVTVKK